MFGMMIDIGPKFCTVPSSPPYMTFELGAVAESEACPLGIQETLSSIPMDSTIFRGDLVMKKFLQPFSLFADSRRAVVSYWRKNVHKVLVNCLEGLPRNKVVRVTDITLNDLKCVEGS